MMRKRYKLDTETRDKTAPRFSHIGLGVTAHAYMCESATLTPDQALLIAQHDRMEEQTMVYAAAAGVDTVTVIVGDTHFGNACPYLEVGCGVGRDVLVVHGGDFITPMPEPRMFKMEPRMLREIEPPAVVPRKGKKRDWEQRTRKQKRR